MMGKVKSLVRDSFIEAWAPFASKAYTELPHVRVIALHDIPPASYPLFEKKMEWLKERYNLVSLRNLRDRKGLSDRQLNLALTFDDGFKEHATFVAPLLSRMNVPATFFVPSSSMGIEGSAAARFSKEGLRRSKVFEFMTEADVRVIAQNPLFAIGSHTANHADLGSIFEEEGLNREIRDDKKELEKVIGRPIEFLAFPFGSYANVSCASLRKIQEVGHKGSFTIVPSFWKKMTNPYLVGRDSLAVEMSDPLWEGFLRGGYDAVSSLKGYRQLRALQKNCGGK